MPKINWDEISEEQFEKFIFNMIGHYGFINREWCGKSGADKGRDIIAYTIEKLPLGLEFQRKWVIQCKKWKSFPPKNVIDREISSAKEHNPDFWLLVVPQQPSANMIDYLHAMDKNCKFKILLLTKIHIEEEFMKNPELLKYLLSDEIKGFYKIIKEIGKYKILYSDREILGIKKGKIEKTICDNMPSYPEISPNKKLLTFIAPYAWERIGELYIFDIKTLESNIIVKKDDIEINNTVKEVLWVNNNLLLLIIGQTYGTMTVGGNLYIFNLEKNKLTLFRKATGYNEFKDIRIEEGKLKFDEVKFYEDSTGYFVEKKLNVSLKDIKE